MRRFIEGESRAQATLFPERLDDWIAEDNPVRAVDAFVDELDLAKLGLEGAEPAATGRPACHPGTPLKIYIYGYLNRLPSSRRVERETQRNPELIWLTGRLAPDFKTIADFRCDNGPGIRQVCRQFVQLCREIGLFEQALMAIDGSKFKAVNDRDKNFTPYKLKARQQQLDQSIARYRADLDRADRDPSLVPEERVEHLKEKLVTVRAQMKRLEAIGRQLAVAPDQQISLTDPDARSQAQITPLVPKPMTSNSTANGCFDKRDFMYQPKHDRYRCPAGEHATRRCSSTGKGMREHEDVVERMQRRIDGMPHAGRLRRQTVERTFGTLKSWMGATHFLTRTRPRVQTDMSLQVLAYNLKRMMQILGVQPLIAAMRA